MRCCRRCGFVWSEAPLYVAADCINFVDDAGNPVETGGSLEVTTVMRVVCRERRSNFVLTSEGDPDA